MEAENVNASQFAWPNDQSRLSALEVAIGIPDGADPLQIYLSRVSPLTITCMTEGHLVDYVAGEPLNEEAQVRMTGPLEFRGLAVLGGCDQWAHDHAFPGNHFGSKYRELKVEALNRDEYIEAVAAYDQCFIKAGFGTVPTIDGLTNEAAQQVLDDYNRAGESCETSAGLRGATRSVEILVGDALALGSSDNSLLFGSDQSDEPFAGSPIPSPT